LSSSGSTHHHEEQWKHKGNEFCSNVHKFLLVSWGFFKRIISLVKANIRKFGQCCLEVLTIQVSHVCIVPFSKRPFTLQITDLSNTTIDYKISLLRAGALLVDDAHGLGNFRESLLHFIIHPLCCQATLIMANPHGFF